ncbi:hypothetical protein CVD28_02680 [Bacillus sp. M6-12]|uniref:hypothetical protein n=1 Tax=Bacillus sp. M6-12 TaxID=2054166 RepID=UPI000C759D66|nr:hypothetical protein [Bacillus sp. M6-12]PLS19338.1 hypothetical protein CVD28_02680 [Bacillus sp. M6-12]
MQDYLNAIKKWWLRTIYGIGETVFWNNRVDSSFTGEYIVTSKRDKNGYVHIYNEKKGHRVVPYYYLDFSYQKD